MSRAASDAVAVTYVPADCGSVIPGKSKAPEAFRKVGLINKLLHEGIPDIEEYHALNAPATYSISAWKPESARNEALNIDVCRRVKESLLVSLKSRPQQRPSFQLVLGGECGMLPAVLSAFWQHAGSSTPRKRVGLIYIDADTDLSSPTDPGTTGNFAGMNMTHLVRTEGALESMRPFSQPNGEPVCDSSNMVLFGTNMALPGNTRDHFAYLFDNNYKVVSSTSVAREPEQRAKEVLKYFEDRVDVIMVHLDVDAIDPRMFPLANLPNFTGVAFEEMMRALEVFMSDGKVGGLTIAEVNPNHDPDLAMVEKLTSEVVRMLKARVGK